MTPRVRKLFTFPIDDDLSAGLRKVKEDKGIGISEQIRRAIRDWLQREGVIKKAERKRVAARKRS